jgi:hypothetical protein
MAVENTKHERAAAAFKNRLLAERDRDRAVRMAARGEASPQMSILSQRRAA